MNGTLGWIGIFRLGLVQAAIGAMVMISTSVLNRVMIVELQLAAAIPAGLVAWHYAVQLSRPVWGHRSDRGRRRTTWIVGGMGALALGTLLALDAAVMMPAGAPGFVLGALAYTLIGGGVGAAGTSLLALLAASVTPERRAGAAALTWIMMIAGIVVSAGVIGSLIEPFSFERLSLVIGGAVLAAFVLTLGALYRLEGGLAAQSREVEAPTPFGTAIRSVWQDATARRFTIFVFVSMLAYSMQDLILEPFGGLIFGLGPGATTQLSGVHHGGVLIGMIVTGVGCGALARRRQVDLSAWIVAGCVVSAVALLGLVYGAASQDGGFLRGNLFVLGLGNGIFAAAAVGTMMALAGQAGTGQSGIRMGVWGAAQAVAFGLGGLLGAVAVDVLRGWLGVDAMAFQAAFAGEAGLFVLSAILALTIVRARAVEPAKMAVA